MLRLHPKILEKNGKREFAVLPYEEFQRLTEALSDYEDLKDLRTASADEGATPGQGLADVRKELDI